MFEIGKGISASALLWSLSSPKLEIGSCAEMLNFLSISLCRIDPYGWCRIHLRMDTHTNDVDHFTTWNLRSAHLLAIVGDYHSCSGLQGFLRDFFFGSGILFFCHCTARSHVKRDLFCTARTRKKMTLCCNSKIFLLWINHLAYFKEVWRIFLWIISHWVPWKQNIFRAKFQGKSCKF